MGIPFAASSSHRRSGPLVPAFLVALFIASTLAWWRSQNTVDVATVPLGDHAIAFRSGYGELHVEYFKRNMAYHGPWIQSLPLDALSRGILKAFRQEFHLGLHASTATGLSLGTLYWWPESMIAFLTLWSCLRWLCTPHPAAPPAFVMTSAPAAVSSPNLPK